MKPKAKAIQLVSNFMGTIIFSINQNIEVSVMDAAKNCALILVDEMLSSNIYSFNETYYLKVKKEINKI